MLLYEAVLHRSRLREADTGRPPVPYLLLGPLPGSGEFDTFDFIIILSIVGHCIEM
jgi:hypothetical protein